MPFKIILGALPDEEELVRLLGFESLTRITEFTRSKTKLDLHYPTQNLKTPLSAAIDRGDVKIMEMLIDKYEVALDSTTTQPCGRTALMHASYVTRNIEVLRALIARGADVQKTDIRGWNCLYYAVVGERIGNIEYLLESGADINSRDTQGRTPLMIAAIAKLLLDCDANTGIADDLGYSALRLAILWKKHEQAMLLVDSGNDGTCVPKTSAYSDYELAEYLMPGLRVSTQGNNSATKTL